MGIQNVKFGSDTKGEFTYLIQLISRVVDCALLSEDLNFNILGFWIAVKSLMLLCLLELIFVCGPTDEESCTKKKIVLSSCATNLHPEMEHVREIRKGGFV